MSTGYSINIGVSNPREGCCSKQEIPTAESNAAALAALAAALPRFTAPDVLVGTKARVRAVEDAIQRLRPRLVAGDFLLLTYVGHGCRQTLLASASTERDRFDETWCLSDDFLADDHLFSLLAGLPAGVRVLVLSDSCHSGSVIFRSAGRLASPTAQELEQRAERAARLAARQGLQEAPGPMQGIGNLRLPLGTAPRKLAAEVLFVAACREAEVAQAGLFTAELLRLWNRGGFTGTYVDLIRELHHAVVKRNRQQHPGWAHFGPSGSAFIQQRPFTV